MNEWMERARECESLDEFCALWEDAMEQPQTCDSAVRVVGALAVAAAQAASEQVGGLTGFQAGQMFWEFHYGLDLYGGSPARLVTYEDMLYPQYLYRFEKTIPGYVWEWLQTEAKNRLTGPECIRACTAVREHWVSIAAGKVPFGYTVAEGM